MDSSVKTSTLKTQLKVGLILLAIAIILGLFNEAFGQTREQKIDRARRELSAQAETYLTEFNNMRLNFVNPRVQSFLSERLDLVLIGEPQHTVTDSLITITEEYKKKISKHDNKLTVTYKVVPDGSEMVIQSCQISGFDVYVFDFFIKYWKTTLNFEDVKKEEIVVNYWISDRASLSMNNQQAVIDIVKND